MRFEVLREFTFAGENLVRGDVVEIPDESSKIGALTRSKFIRVAGETAIVKVQQPLPAVAEVVAEIQREPELAGISRSPKEIVREAKARAAKK